MKEGRRHRVAMVCSHAIQYFMPWFRQLAAHPQIDLLVLLGDDHGLHEASYDPGFGREVRWDVPLLLGIPVRQLKNHAMEKGVGRFFGIVSLDLLFLLSRRHFDAVVIHGWNYALYPLALLSARLHGLPVLLRAESPLPKEGPPVNLKGTLKRAVLSRYVGLCAGALAVSSGNRRLLRHYGMPDERIFSCPYAVDGERFALSGAERQRARQAVRQELGLMEDMPLVLLSGKLQPVKEPGLLLCAYADLRRQGVQAALCFVGDGELRQELQAQAAQVPDVHFLGFKNQSELPAVYAAADLLVLPSRQETFGLVVNEAMHAGLPVICSDGVGCAEDLVREGETGLIFPRGDLLSLTDCLHRLCTDKDLRQRMGSAGARHIRSWTFAQATSGLLAALSTLGPLAPLEARR